MTIDEAIEYEKKNIEINELIDKVCGSKTKPYHKQIAEQIAEWLEELKIIKEMDLEIPQHFTKEQSEWIKAYCIKRNIEFYNKAIDDLEKTLKSKPYWDDEHNFQAIPIDYIDEVVEKLIIK